MEGGGWVRVIRGRSTPFTKSAARAPQQNLGTNQHTAALHVTWAVSHNWAITIICTGKATGLRY